MTEPELTGLQPRVAGDPEVAPVLEIKNMKSLLFVSLVLVLVLCIFSTVGAVGQTIGVLSAQPQTFQVPDHPETASQQGMGQAHNIMERSGNVSGRGEKPLWEAMQEMPATPVTPLGDSARALKKEHAAAKKASIVWNN